MKPLHIILTKDTEHHKKGAKGIILSNPGRGILSAYDVLFDDGKREYVVSEEFDIT